MGYDIFGVNGGTSTATAPARTTRAGSNSRSTAGGFDVFGINNIQAVAPPSSSPASPSYTAPQQSQPQSKPQSNPFSNILNKAQTVGKDVVQGAGKAVRAVARPVIDTVSGQGGKLARDTSQLSSDLTGGSANYLLKTAIANPIKETAATISGNKQAQVNATTNSNKDLGLGAKGTDIKHGLIKTGAEAALTAANFAGGGEIAGTKNLLKAGAKVAGKQVAKDAAIGTTFGGAGTLANNPSAGIKEVAKNAVLGGATAAAIPHVLTGVGNATKAIADKTGMKSGDLKTGQADLQNAKVNTLLQTNKTPASISEPGIVTQATERNGATNIPENSGVVTHQYTPTNPKVKTLMEVNQKQTDALQAPAKAAEAEQATAAKTAQDTQAKVQKIDRQTQLIQAKGKDSQTGLSNVDQTKLTHLQEDKQQLQTSAVSETATTPLASVSEKVPVESTPAVPLETAKSTESVSSGNSTPKISNRQQTEVKTSGAEPTIVPIKQTTVNTPDIGVPKLAQGVEANAVKKGLTSGFADKPEYAKVNIKQQSDAATNLVKTDPERAFRIAMGHERPPEGLLPESAFIAVEHAATKTGNVEVLRQLAAESHLTSEATGMGQRIRMLGERDTNSPVSNIKKVQAARVAALERKTGKTVATVTNDELKQIRAAKASVPKQTKETFASFVDSLKC